MAYTRLELPDLKHFFDYLFVYQASVNSIALRLLGPSTAIVIRRYICDQGGYKPEGLESLLPLQSAFKSEGDPPWLWR
jgi:hypothetical protein